MQRSSWCILQILPTGQPANGFRWSLSVSKSLQVSGALLFPYCLAIWFFFNDLFVPYFVAFLASGCWYILPLLARKLFFRCFGMSCFVSAVSSYVGIFLVFLSPVSSDLYLRVESFVQIVLHCSFCFTFFLCFNTFDFCLSFLICVSSLISPPGFEFLFVLWRTSIFHKTDKMKQAAVVSILLYGCTTWTLTKRLKKKLDGNYTRMLRAILNKSRRQHPTNQQLYSHLPPITKTIQVRRTKHAGHCWRSRDELISDVLQWTPRYGWAKAGRPARRYIQ